MRAISLIQPWASIIFAEIPFRKQYETRNWWTEFRGPLWIHASGQKSFGPAELDLCYRRPFLDALRTLGLTRKVQSGEAVREYPLTDKLPFGAIIGQAHLVSCTETDDKRGKAIIANLSSTERAFGNFGPKRTMFELASARLLPKPIPCRGALNIWTIPPEVEAQLMALVVA